MFLFHFLLVFGGLGDSYVGPNFDIQKVQVRQIQDLGLLVFEMQVRGQAGKTVPRAKGQMEGAPVLGYVFPTDLKPSQVGFGSGQGIVALAVTAHPDFDDTPLWDENRDGNYGNDGVIYHTHWVVLTEDKRVPGGLSVLAMRKEEMAAVLPPTAPGMPMYMDSPGFDVRCSGSLLRVLVPMNRLTGDLAFHFDGVTAYMEVRTQGDFPMLGVYQVYAVASKDLSLPYTVQAE
ncbi:MAG: hypothetical protein H6510_14820 [Acidobacteria bacterium]|nr:hypothetical protein [Acidobacteriota bacterium]MCB9399085.1 hypothetical protein [Acidobacteriota bacterium]